MSADVQLPEGALPLDVLEERDQGTDTWERASSGDVHVDDVDDEPGLFLVEFQDGGLHNCRVAREKGQKFGYVGWCDCDGFNFHAKTCAHLCRLVQADKLANESLVPVVDYVEQDVDAEVVEQDTLEDDDQDEPVQDDVDEEPEAATPDVVDEPRLDRSSVTQSSATTPATPSDPFAEQLAQDVPERYMMELGGDVYIRRAGYAAIARHADLSVQVEALVPADETDFQHARYEATVADASGRVLARDVGTAHLEEEDMDGAAGELDELASTRAIRRALEWATGAGATLDVDDDRAVADGGCPQ